MASLKEIKVRIASIQSTQKITSAMKMVSSAKLHHAQMLAERTQAYADKMSAILNCLLAAECDWDSPFVKQREVKQIAVVVFSSGSGLCGTFNANMWKELSVCLRAYEREGISVRLYAVGKKVADELHKAGYAVTDDFLHLGENPTYGGAASLAGRLMDLYATKEVDRIELLYHHFKTIATQVLTSKIYLPFSLQEPDGEGGNASAMTDYILEPSAEDLQQTLLPKLLNLVIYTTLLDTSTAEHAARMMAMQTANDNANDLIQKLTLQYNKTRQQTITNELLDIMGGAG